MQINPNYIHQQQSSQEKGFHQPNGHSFVNLPGIVLIKEKYDFYVEN